MLLAERQINNFYPESRNLSLHRIPVYSDACQTLNTHTVLCCFLISPFRDQISIIMVSAVFDSIVPNKKNPIKFSITNKSGIDKKEIQNNSVTRSLLSHTC